MFRNEKKNLTFNLFLRSVVACSPIVNDFSTDRDTRRFLWRLPHKLSAPDLISLRGVGLHLHLSQAQQQENQMHLCNEVV